MKNDRKVIREKRLREDKIKEALSKKPSTPFMNSYGLTPAQIHQNLHRAKLNGASRQEIKRTVLKRKAHDERPQKAKRPKIQTHNKNLLLDHPNVSTRKSIEYPTPEWFRKTEKADVSIIVPLFKSNDVVKGLIRSWDIKEDVNFELIFVDDSCPNNSKDMATRIWNVRKHEFEGMKIGRIYYNPENLGFGMTCNVGAENATGDYLIFLNADTLVTKNWITPIVKLLKDPEVGLVGNLQIKKGGPWDGTIDSAGSEWSWDARSFLHIGRHSYRNKGLGKPFYPDNAPKDLMEVGEREMVTGCCVGVRRELFQEIGGFNPNYRIGYWEDSDLSLTVREKGYKVMYTPHSKIFHLLGHTGSGPHRFHEHNKHYFANKWIHSGRIDPLIKSKRKRQPKVRSILIKRREARGDVLLATAVAAALKKKHPDCTILFNTKCPEVVKGNPHIDRIVEDHYISERSFQVYYNLDVAYEQRPHSHILDAYAEAVGVKREDCELFMNQQPFPKSLPSDYVVIHAGKTSWVGRDWEQTKFESIAKRLKAAGHNVVCVGTKSDNVVPCTVDIRGETNLSQLATVIKNSKLFVGIDSCPMHIAQAVDVPGVCFFGSIDPDKRIVSKKMKGITAKNLECLGCHHRKPTPSVVTNVCETRTLDCLEMVTVDMMWKAIERELNADAVHNVQTV